MKEIIEVSRDSGGNLKVKLDKYRSKVAPYTYNGDIYNSDTGRQAFANASGYKLYITGIYLLNNSGTGYQFKIFDGTVAAGTARVDIDVGISAEPDIWTSLPLGPFTSTSGIYVWGATGCDFGLVIEISKDPVTVE